MPRLTSLAISMNFSLFLQQMNKQFEIRYQIWSTIFSHVYLYAHWMAKYRFSTSFFSCVHTTFHKLVYQLTFTMLVHTSFATTTVFVSIYHNCKEHPITIRNECVVRSCSLLFCEFHTDWKCSLVLDAMRWNFLCHRVTNFPSSISVVISFFKWHELKEAIQLAPQTKLYISKFKLAVSVQQNCQNESIQLAVIEKTACHSNFSLNRLRLAFYRLKDPLYHLWSND